MAASPDLEAGLGACGSTNIAGADLRLRRQNHGKKYGLASDDRQ
jgi:hypothetical protein